MILFEKQILNNGLKVIVHRDTTTPLAAVNICYNVGSRDEDPLHTGFAHLFEHLMFGGSVHIDSYDTPLQQVGGENNAFTSKDITNYYLTLPAENIETGFWLESDRMLELAFSPKSLNTQKSVVIEEFKQRYLNQPYGDTWALLDALAYQIHPYRWPTIGSEVSHIQDATLDQVKSFFYKHYAPNNAVLVVTGNVDPDYIFQLAEKWFAPIPARNISPRNIPQEPVQTEPRFRRVERNIPIDNLYLAFHMSDRLSPDYYKADLISDILSNGDSSRLYRKLVIEEQLFSELDAFISGNNDPGLFLISGKPAKGVSLDKAREVIFAELKTLCNQGIKEKELEKVKNKFEATLVYSEINFLNKAMGLANFENMKDAAEINNQVAKYRNVSADTITQYAKQLFTFENSSTLYYCAKK